ncbi:hypothetical protein D1872_169930 [compost metagenome]
MDSFLNKPHLLADEVHPNDLGYRVITDLFLNKQSRSTHIRAVGQNGKGVMPWEFEE